MKFKKGCKCPSTKGDLLMAIGAAVIAVIKAITTLNSYNKEKIAQGDSAKADFHDMLKKAGVK